MKRVRPPEKAAGPEADDRSLRSRLRMRPRASMLSEPRPEGAVGTGIGKRVQDLRWVAIVLALAMVPISLAFGDYDRAETHLREFYVRMSKADFDGGHRSIDEAVRLWPSNARYHAWRGYSMSQNLPSQCSPPGAGLSQEELQRLTDRSPWPCPGVPMPR